MRVPFGLRSRTLALGLTVLGGLGLSPLAGSSDDLLEREAVRLPPPEDHGEFSQVLAGVIQVPRVNYGRLLEERAALDRYLLRLEQTDPSLLESATRSVQLAFWINAYNACMLRRVVDHYPIRPGGAGLLGSVRNRVVGYPEDSVWQIRDVFTQPHCGVAGKLRSQDEIEHQIIRPRFQEPRIHFAVNCAAVSCPVLWPEAYEAATLDAQLDRAVRHLIQNPAHFRLEGANPATLTLNKVLEWYADDFGGTEGLKTFFAPYVQGSARARLEEAGTLVRFFEYDWALNDVRR